MGMAANEFELLSLYSEEIVPKLEHVASYQSPCLHWHVAEGTLQASNLWHMHGMLQWVVPGLSAVGTKE